MSKQIYHYSQETGEYIAHGFAKLSPLDLKKGKEVYLIPSHATDVEPPEPKEGKIRTFVDGKWKYYDIPTPIMVPEPTETELLQMQIYDLESQLRRLDDKSDAETLFNILKQKGVLTDKDLPKDMADRFAKKYEIRKKLKQLA
jgi:hypothetical protein